MTVASSDDGVFTPRNLDEDALAEIWERIHRFFESARLAVGTLHEPAALEPPRGPT